MSDFAEGYAVGADRNTGNNCCYPMMPWGMMGGYGGFGGGLFGGGAWGGDLLAIVVLAALFGNGGWGGFGFGGGCGGGVYGEVQRGFDTSAITNKLNGIENGLCDGFYAMNTNTLNGFASVQNALCQGFNGVNTAIYQNGYDTRTSITDVGYALKDCCCQTQRAIDGVRYENQANTCALSNTINNTTRDIIENANNNNRALMDFLVADKLASKDARIAQLENSLSQSQQNNYIGATVDAAVATILRRSGHDCPQPAYVVQPPQPVTFPTNSCGTANYAAYGNNGVGCGCGCGL